MRSINHPQDDTQALSSRISQAPQRAAALGVVNIGTTHDDYMDTFPHLTESFADTAKVMPLRRKTDHACAKMVWAATQHLATLEPLLVRAAQSKPNGGNRVTVTIKLGTKYFYV